MRGFIFPSFVLTSVALVIVAWWSPDFLAWLASPWTGGMGVMAVLAAMGLGWKGYLPLRLSYDLFLWGTLWCWLAYWFPLYGPEALVFRAYPVFFFVMDLVMVHIVSVHKARVTVEEHRLLAVLAAQWWFDGKLFAGLVLAGLAMPGHYLVYPAAVGMLMLRMLLDRVLSPGSAA